MYLRNLEIKDAPLMLAWMHDDSVVHDLYTDFASKTIEDCKAFIKAAENKEHDIHLAIASDEDEYMGTVSLKNIDRTNKSAEFAITVRKCSMGKGYSWFGMKEIIRKAFEEYGLENVYWCVSRTNERAVRFYDKHNFHKTVDISNDILNRYEGMDNLKWYSVLKGDVLDGR
ncbi:MAG: GNAT family N-acetyltransferase [Synergistaceae bacterium]|nr:GNAT family N-acetyltransferase [Synergistaceae bacterium]